MIARFLPRQCCVEVREFSRLLLRDPLTASLTVHNAFPALDVLWARADFARALSARLYSMSQPVTLSEARRIFDDVPVLSKTNGAGDRDRISVENSTDAQRVFGLVLGAGRHLVIVGAKPIGAIALGFG